MSVTPFVATHNPIFDVSQRYIGTSNDVSSLCISTKSPSEGNGSLVCPTAAAALNSQDTNIYTFSLPIGSANRPYLAATTLKFYSYVCDVNGADLAGGNLQSVFLPWNAGFALIRGISIRLNNSNAEVINIPDFCTELLSLHYLCTHSLESTFSDPAIFPPIWKDNDEYLVTSAVGAGANTGLDATGTRMSCRERTEKVLGVGKLASSTKVVSCEIPLTYFGLPPAVLNNCSFIEIKLNLRQNTQILANIGTVAEQGACYFNCARIEMCLSSPIQGIQQSIETTANKALYDDNISVIWPRERRSVPFNSGGTLQLTAIKHLQKCFFYQCAKFVTTNVANCTYTDWGQFLPWRAGGLAPILRAIDHVTNPITNIQAFYGSDLSFPMQPIQTANTGRFEPSELAKLFLAATNQLCLPQYSPIINISTMRATMPMCILSPFMLNAGAHIDTMPRNLDLRITGGPNGISFNIVAELLRAFKITSSGDLITVL